MTFPELITRANTIWGHKRVLACYVREDGALDVNCIRLGRSDDVRGRSFTAHRLNPEGIPVCHTDCQDLAKEGTGV